jgi:hypothetical protein
VYRSGALKTTTYSTLLAAAPHFAGNAGSYLSDGAAIFLKAPARSTTIGTCLSEPGFSQVVGARVCGAAGR